MNALDVAIAYIGRGWAPIPIPYRKKRPTIEEWPRMRITEAEAPRYFNGDRQNIGINLGEASGGLVDLDLDCPEALAMATRFLPPSGSIFGRQSKPGSHRLYVSAVPKTVQFQDPDGGEMLLELRSSGAQTVFPPSIHESGERIDWAGFDEPMQVNEVRLAAAASDLAVACLLVRGAPAENRHAYLLDIAGALIRANRSAAGRIHHAVAQQTLADRYNKAEGDRLLDDTIARLARNDPACGWPRLVERIGEKRARQVAHWLGFVPATGPSGEAEEHAPQPWPEPLAPEAYHGIAGEIVRKLEPETEADPASLLFQLLTGLGSIMGREGYARVEADTHPPRIWDVQVGRTSKGRKGTAWGRIRELLASVAPVWAMSCIASGMSSGEGVIFAVRDPIEVYNKGKAEILVPGVEDKRLLLFEGEFAKALRNMERQGNILSAVLRDAWDHGNLRTLIKNNPNRATGAHVSLNAHITVDELRRCLDRTEMANGLANRILFVCVQRSRMLPRGGLPIDWSDITDRLNLILAGVPTGEIRRTDAFWVLWEQVYPELSADRPGLLGAILGRAEAQVLRLALVYALLDRQAFMDECHLRAALACWKYAEESARFIFGDTLGDPVADEILRALRLQPTGMTRNDLMDHFGRNRSSAEIGCALAILATGNFASCTREATKGRPVERWFAWPC